MNRGFGRRLTLSLGFVMISGLFLAQESSGQILAVGGHLSVNQDIADDMTWGVGARAHLGLPLTGINLQGTADFFSPDCGPLDCSFREVSLNLIWTLPVPIVATPYLGAGVAVQNAKEFGFLGDDSDYGLNFLGGIILDGPTFQRIKPFGEVKYQMMRDFDAQTVFSFGLLLSII